MASVLVLAAGCGNKNAQDQTQNPDDVAADGADDTATESAKPSRARGSTATRGAGRGTKARNLTAKKPPRETLPLPAEPAEGGEEEQDAGPNGLLAVGYNYEPAKGFPEDVSAVGEAIDKFEVPNLDFDEIDFSEGFPGSSALKEKYLLSFMGSLNVVEEAEYELCLHSDDGSRLMLEGMAVIDNGTIHDGAVETCELLYLAPGEYQLQIDYMQDVGPLLTMHFAWSINGGEKVIVPSEVLFKPEGDPTAG